MRAFCVGRLRHIGRPEQAINVQSGHPPDTAFRFDFVAVGSPLADAVLARASALAYWKGICAAKTKTVSSAGGAVATKVVVFAPFPYPALPAGQGGA